MGPIYTYRDLIKKASEKLIPLHCLFELTYECNLSCVHCYITKGPRKELNTQEILYILKELKNAGCLYLTLSGGEIFMRSDIFEIAEHARKLNFALTLFTNGTLINKGAADRIRAFKPAAVEISIYGFRKTHEEITNVKGSFDKTISAVELLKKRGIKVFIKATPINKNIKEIWNLEKFTKERLKVNWRGTKASLIAPCDNGNKKPLQYRLNREELRNYFSEVIKRGKCSKSTLKMARARSGQGLCNGGFTTCSITPYGALNPCVQLKLKENSLKGRHFMEIWHNNKDIQGFRGLRLSDKKECFGCKLTSYCMFCPGLALLECGSLAARLPDACLQAEVKKEVYSKL